MSRPPIQPSAPQGLCAILAWDSAFFSVPVARVLPERPTDEQLAHALDWCRGAGVACAYLLLDAAEPLAPRRAEAAGFNFVDIRATYAIDLQPTPPASLMIAPSFIPCRPHKPTDVPHLAAIARSSHRDTRFSADGHFPKDRCDLLYEVWIRRSCEDGFADIVWVADLEGVPCGYVTCSIDKARFEGNIGIVGVAEAARGRGAARAMITAALEWFIGQGVRRVSVVTQGRNLPAQRLYQRCGFTISDLQLWFHKWF